MITLTQDQQTAADEFMEFMIREDEHMMIIKGHAGA